jgi:hypothetical protein
MSTLTSSPVGKSAKWGVWGKDYDTIVIVLLGNNIDDIEVTEWKNRNFENLKCTFENERYCFEHGEKYWKTRFTFQNLTFQKCRTYLS